MSMLTRVLHITAADLQPARLAPALTAGLVTGIFNIIVAISFAALIFSGELTLFVAQAIGLFLLGSSIAVVLIGLLSSYPGVIGAPQDAPAAILALVSVAIMRSLPSATAQEKFITVVAAIALTSLLTGLGMILVGRFRLGALVRFLPYPVVGGFLAGTGWLLVTGGIGVMADLSVELTHLTPLVQSDVWLRWVPGVAWAVVMLVILNRFSQGWLLPALLVGVALLFYAVAWLTGASVAQINADRWLLGPFPAGDLWPPISLTDLGLVHWPAVLGQSSALASIFLVSVVSLLLNASGIELVIRRDLLFNRELWAAGVGNMTGGLLGGPVSYHALSDTTLNYRISQGSPLTVWMVALLSLVTLFFGASLLAYVPKLVLGSLLVLLGLSFLYEWVYLAWFKFPRRDYLIVLLILGVIAAVGYLPGVQVGIVAAIALFVLDYSRVSVVKHALTGKTFKSRVTRSRSQQQRLIERGDELYILQLQGFIFFGTANNLLEQVRQRLRQTETPVRFVILDFAQVTGLDSTAMLSFDKLRQLAAEQGLTLLLTGLSPRLRRQFEQAGVTDQTTGATRLFPDLDYGVEWCETQMLALVDGLADDTGQSLQAQFQRLLPTSSHVADLFRYLERQAVPAGTYLMRQGDPPDKLYFIESGQVTARLEPPGGDPIRLETMQAGRVVGEIGFYLGQARTAAVIADEPSAIYALSADSLARMEQEAPGAASALHRIIIHLLAERASHLIVTVDTLQRRT